MKTKIVGLFVCMLLIATAVPAVTSVKISTINKAVPSVPLSNTRAIWNEIQKLLPSDGAAADRFGFAVAISGNTVLVGAEGDDDNGNYSGSVYVFNRTGTTWTFQQKLLASDGAPGDDFGRSIAFIGDTALIGAVSAYSSPPKGGSTYVFIRSGSTWTQQQKLIASDSAAYDYFGFSLSLSGETALIGAPGNANYRGAAYVFTRTGTTWTQQQKLTASDGTANSTFGYSVALSGDTALIGAVWDHNYKGAAYVFTRTGTTWTQQQKLTSSDGVAGDCFGNVALENNTAFIGAPFDDDMGTDSGSVYVFTSTGTTWIQQQKLTASDGGAGNQFGAYAISLDGNTALIGAYQDNNNGYHSGSAYVFTRTGTTWIQQTKLLASDGATEDWFGYSVALDGNTAIIGAYNDDDNGADSGSAYVFMNTAASLTYNITGGFGVNLKIKNNGTLNATSIPWQIQVKGGILGLINKTVNGTIDIPAGGSKTVGTGMLFGFGALSITATVADEEKIAKGTQIIFYSMVKK